MITGQMERQRQSQAYYADGVDEAILVDRPTPEYCVVVVQRQTLLRWFGKDALVEGLFWEVES